MKVVVLVGRRSDGGGIRDRIWEYVAARWAGFGWPVSVGYDEGPGPFSLALASNRAAALAGDWDVAVYIGADWVAATREQVNQAVDLAASSGQLVFAHNRTGLLTHDASDRLLRGATLQQVSGEAEWHRNTFSGVLCVRRSLWDDVGGFDERFRGWGWDDLAFWSACSALAGYDRVDGAILHLWHPQPRELREGSLEHAENEPLGRRYLAAKNDREAMLAIIGERNER